MEKIPTETEKREHLRKIINAAHSGMFITQGVMGLHGRPMANAEVTDPFTTLWFATSRSSVKMDELKRDDRVFLAYHNGGTEWATISGRARAVDDRAKIRELWSPLWKVWFESADDPDIILLEVTPEGGEYWDSGNKVAAYIKFAVGALAGKDLSREDHQVVAM
jgi:general stress protein 26